MSGLFLKYPLILLLIIFFAQAQTALTGDIHDHIFNVKDNPYVIKENIIIPSGTSCTIPAECVFIFQPFTGLTVEGTLTVQGTKENPVVFTSVNDSLYNPGSVQQAAPFDWNGIIIAAESYGSSFTHVRIGYSVYGIKSQTPNITLSQCVFIQNGQYNFTIKEQLKNVLENYPFSYPEVIIPPVVPSDSFPQQKGKGLKIALRIGTLAVGIAGITGGAILYNEVKKSERKLDAITDDVTTPSDDEFHYDTDDFTRENNRRKQLQAESIAGFVLGGLGMAGFVISFVF